MSNLPDKPDPLVALQRLTLTEVEQRLADLDGERAALSLLRRSLIARDRVKRRHRLPVNSEGGHRNAYPKPDTRTI